jgi:hypothetical protein
MSAEPVSGTPLYPLDPGWTEVIFAPLHDPQIAPELDQSFELVSAKRGRLEPFWCYTVLHWEEAPPGTDAAVYTLRVDIPLAGFDTLLLCLAMPAAAAARVQLRIDGAWCPDTPPVAGTAARMEHAVPLPVGNRLQVVRLWFSSRDSGDHAANLSWIGLANAALQATVLGGRRRYDESWPGLIAPEEKWGEPCFARGLLFSAEDLPALRAKWRLPAWRDHAGRMEAMAESYLRRIPEADVHDFLPTNDVRYIRAREMGSTMYCWEAVAVGFVGLMRADHAMIRHALRSLLCMLHTPSWACSAENRLPGSTWDMRCFHEAMAAVAVSLLADWFAYALTPRARDLTLQSLWDKGLAVVERDMMKHAYLYSCNQGPWFAGARLLGGLMLEKAWPCVGDYADRAYADMLRALDGYVQADGGLDEGIGYYGQTMQAASAGVGDGRGHRGLDPAAFLRQRVLPSDAYVATMSGILPGTAIPEGDCRIELFCGDVIPVMAGFFPDSANAKILSPCLAAGSVIEVSGGLTGSGGILGFIFGPRDIQPPQSIVPCFSVLPASGFLSSYRTEPPGRSMRLHVTGSKARPSHSHLDKSGFVLEIDGRMLLVDRGMLSYSHPEANLLKRSCMHNCLTPVLPDGGYADQLLPSAPILPRGTGDSGSLRAEVDATPAWQGLLSRYARRFESDSIRELVVVDTGELAAPGRIAVHLHSPFPFEVRGKRAVLAVGAFELQVEAPWAKSMHAGIDSVDLKNRPISHLVLLSPEATRFSFTTTIRRADAR